MPPRDTKPEQGQPPTEPDPTATSETTTGTVRLAVGYPYDSLTVGDGDTLLEVTSEGTDVPLDREEEVRAAGRTHGVPVRKVS